MVSDALVRAFSDTLETYRPTITCYVLANGHVTVKIPRNRPKLSLLQTGAPCQINGRCNCYRNVH